MFSRLPNYLNLSDNRRNAVKIQLVYSKYARVNHGKSATESRLFRKLEFPIKTYRIISGKSGLFVQSGFPLELYLPRFVTSPQLLRARPTGTHPFRATTLCLTMRYTVGTSSHFHCLPRHDSFILARLMKDEMQIFRECLRIRLYYLTFSITFSLHNRQRMLQSARGAVQPRVVQHE